MFFSRRADDFSTGDSGYDMGLDVSTDTTDSDASQEGISDDTAFSDEDLSEAMDCLDQSSLENLNESNAISDYDEIDEEAAEVLDETPTETDHPDEIIIDLEEETQTEGDGLLEIPHDESEAGEEIEEVSEPELTEPVQDLSQTDVQSVNDISGWVGDINPNFDPFDMDSPYCNNCGSCALAVEKMLDGAESAEASDVNIGTIEEMEDLTGMTQMKMDYNDIENYLHMQGPGSHGIVGIDRVDGPGHWFNAYFDGKDVVCIDGQTGEVSGWPPDYGNVSNVDFSVKKAG